LLDAATGAGIINKEKTRYAVKGKEKLYWEKDLYRDDVIGEFLSEINEWLHSNSKEAKKFLCKIYKAEFVTEEMIDEVVDGDFQPNIGVTY